MYMARLSNDEMIHPVTTFTIPCSSNLTKHSHFTNISLEFSTTSLHPTLHLKYSSNAYSPYESYQVSLSTHQLLTMLRWLAKLTALSNEFESRLGLLIV